MKRTAIRVEPISTYLERRRRGPIYPVIVAGQTVYVSGLPPFDPESGEIKRVPFARQSELVLQHHETIRRRLCRTAQQKRQQFPQCPLAVIEGPNGVFYQTNGGD
jgi:enamine deaminase RidA (YjgF/YER057c/UK114 family)